MIFVISSRACSTSLRKSNLGGVSLLRSCFPDYPGGVLGEILALALVRVELLLDVGLGLWLPTKRLMRWKLHVAELADSQHWSVVNLSDDPQFSLCHEIGRAWWR